MFGGIISGLTMGINAIATILAKVIPAVVKAVGVNLEKLGSALEGFFKALGLILPEDNVTNLGDKALQAEEEGIKPEKYDSYAEYLKAVESFETDPEKSLTINENDKLEKGLEVMVGVALEVYGPVIQDLLMIMAKNTAFFNDRGVAIAGYIKENPKFITDFVNYIEGKENDLKKSDATFEKLVSIEKNITPEASQGEIWKRISDLKE